MTKAVFTIASSLALLAGSVLAVDNKPGRTSTGPAASRAAAPKQKTCPVSGAPIKANRSLTHEGQKIYFCCSGCPGIFNKSPMKYLPNYYRQTYPQQVQVTCPVMDEAINPKLYADLDGQRIYVCCEDCIEVLKENPAKYLAKLKDVSTGQVHCPVTGKPINPEIGTEVAGKPIYFCSQDSLEKFTASPAAYAAALRPEVGVVARGPTAADDLILPAVSQGEPEARHRRDLQAVEHEGKTFFVGSTDDAAKFRADPNKYISALQAELDKQAKAAAAHGHPQTRPAKP